MDIIEQTYFTFEIKTQDAYELTLGLNNLPITNNSNLYFSTK